VIWVGIEPYDDLSMMMKSLHNDLKIIGFKPDRQNLVPHLTLGRIKFLRDKIRLYRAINQYKTISSEPIHIDEMILYESILHREGPEYVVVEKFPLQ
jgi:2'-5' RNA ligase